MEFFSISPIELVVSTRHNQICNAIPVQVFHPNESERALETFGSATAPAYEEPHAQSPATGTPDIAWSDWWKVFHDPVLDNLEAQATDANRDIRIALAHVDQTNAMTRSVHSYQLPTIGASPSFSRSRVAQDSPGNVTKPGPAATFNDLLLPLTLNY